MFVIPRLHPLATIWLRTSWPRSPCVTGSGAVPACGKPVLSTTEVTKFDVVVGVPLFPEYCVVVFRICEPPTSWKYFRTCASYAPSLDSL